MTPFKVTTRVTSKFGYREYWNNGKLIKEQHQGIDLVAQAASEDDWKIREVTGGKVLRISRDNSRGLYIDIETAPRVFERYQHLAQSYVKVGDIARQGDIIALAGNTGNSTGRHLHFGVYVNGLAESNAVNPSEWLGLPNAIGTYQGDSKVDVAIEPPPSITTSPKAQLWLATVGPVSGGDKAAFESLSRQMQVSCKINTNDCKLGFCRCTVGPVSKGDLVCIQKLAKQLVVPCLFKEA